ncbi:MAG TPA: diguanylate cyclase [Usitatibacteraceae bacterium]|nr:diguanylate cyclase [Usitatibacteraceae bacterium]
MNALVILGLIFLLGAVLAMFYARSGQGVVVQAAVTKPDLPSLPRDPVTGAYTFASLNAHVAERLKNADVEAALGGFALLLAGFEPAVRADREQTPAIDEADLARIAKRLAQALRSSDFLARTDDGLLAVVVPQVSDRETAARVAQKVIESARLRDKEEGVSRELETTTHIGISLFPGDAQDVESLLADAKQALDAARREGTGSVRFFEAPNPA